VQRGAPPRPPSATRLSPVQQQRRHCWQDARASATPPAAVGSSACSSPPLRTPRPRRAATGRARRADLGCPHPRRHEHADEPQAPTAGGVRRAMQAPRAHQVLLVALLAVALLLLVARRRARWLPVARRRRGGSVRGHRRAAGRAARRTLPGRATTRRRLVQRRGDRRARGRIKLRVRDFFCARAAGAGRSAAGAGRGASRLGAARQRGGVRGRAGQGAPAGAGRVLQLLIFVLVLARPGLAVLDRAAGGRRRRRRLDRRVCACRAGSARSSRAR